MNVFPINPFHTSSPQVRAPQVRARRSLALLLAGLAVCTLSFAEATAGGSSPPKSAYDPETMEKVDPESSARNVPITADPAVEGDSGAAKAPSAPGVAHPGTPSGAVGTLSPRNGGLPSNLWSGSSLSVTRKLLPLMPTSTGSLTIRDLERRLLLTAALPPEGAVDGDRPSWVEMRAERLFAIGDVEGVRDLANVTPPAAAGSLLRRMKLDALLLTSNTDQACREAETSVNPSSDGDLSKLLILCNFLVGKTLEGNLGLDQLHERKDRDRPFLLAVEAVAGQPPGKGKMKLFEPTPLHVAAFAAAHISMPADVLAKGGAGVAHAVALAADTAPDTRFAAADQAETVGSLSSESLRRVYLSTTFSAADLAAPLSRADAVGARGRALLFRAASDQPDHVLRGKLTAKALELGRAKGRFLSTARLFSDILRDLPTESGLEAQAGVLARGLLILGRDDAARPWVNLAKDEQLWPLMTVQTTKVGQSIDQLAFDKWRASLSGLPPAEQSRRAAIVLGTLAGLGVTVPEGAWLDILDPSAAGPNPGLFALMQNSALAGQVGGTALAALAAIGEKPLGTVDSVTIGEVVSALSVAGLGEEARALSMEAMLASGF